MIDMRRYLKNKRFDALTNLSSTATITVRILESESFMQSLSKICSEVNAKKANYLGLNTYLKLDALFRIAGSRLGYALLRKTLHNPYIGLTNAGVVDADKLRFQGTPILSAYMYASIKYRPHFQMAAVSIGEQMTFSVNLRGSSADRDNVRKFFGLLEEELTSIEAL
jgi:NRPS condensation-like uncharacterized protein